MAAGALEAAELAGIQNVVLSGSGNLDELLNFSSLSFLHLLNKILLLTLEF